MNQVDTGWTPDQLGVSGALALAEILHPVEHRVARTFLANLTIRHDDAFCTGPEFSGDAVALFARICEMDQVPAITELSKVFSAEPALIAETAPKPVCKPLPLDADAPFPSDALPPAISEICTSLAQVCGVPPELPALMALGTLSASIGKALSMPSYNGMSIMGNIYTAAGVPPSVGKSVQAAILFGPLHDYQARLLKDHRKHCAAFQSKLAKVTAKLAATEAADEDNTTVSTTDETIEELSQEKADLERALLPPRFLIEDATTEVLAVRLNENIEFVASVSADAKSTISNLAGRYRKGSPEDDIYLKAFSGDAFYQDRISRASISLRNPRLVKCEVRTLALLLIERTGLSKAT